MCDKIVVKFGGSVLRSSKDLKKIIEIVGSYQTPIIAVVSAFSGLTEKLKEAIEKAKKSEGFIESFVQDLLQFHLQIFNEVIGEENASLKTQLLLEVRSKELIRYLKGIHYIDDAPQNVADAVLTYGEKFSSLIISSVLEESGYKAKAM